MITGQGAAGAHRLGARAGSRCGRGRGRGRGRRASTVAVAVKPLELAHVVVHASDIMSLVELLAASVVLHVAHCSHDAVVRTWTQKDDVRRDAARPLLAVAMAHPAATARSQPAAPRTLVADARDLGCAQHSASGILVVVASAMPAMATARVNERSQNMTSIFCRSPPWQGAPRGARSRRTRARCSPRSLRISWRRALPGHCPRPGAPRWAATPPHDGLWLDISLGLQPRRCRGATWAGGGSARFGPPVGHILPDEDE